MNSDYKEIFHMGGPLSRALPNYAYRPEQAVMAKAVGAALARLEPLIVEAGTGTGKTFAYLIPALLSGRSVIISTGTRTLQDQLFRRDVPLLAKALGLPVKIALLKGRTNYLCRHRLDLATQQGALLGPERNVARLLARVTRWAATTKTGDLAELTDLPEQHHLYSRELSGSGMRAIFALPCVRRPPQRAGRRYRRGEPSLIAGRFGAEG
jgi:ATP-dependent DNA helicase DinG